VIIDWHSSYEARKTKDPKCIEGYNCIKVLVKLVFLNDFICHCYSKRLHGVCEGIVVGADHFVEIVDNIFF